MWTVSATIQTKQKLQKPINSSRVPVSHVINTVFPSPIRPNKIRETESNLSRVHCKVVKLQFAQWAKRSLSPKSISQRSPSWKFKPKTIFDPIAECEKKRKKLRISLNETSRNNYITGEITCLRMKLRRSPVRHGYPLVFQTDSSRYYGCRCHRRCASFSIIIIIILVNPCSWLLSFFYEFIVKVK